MVYLSFAGRKLLVTISLSFSFHSFSCRRWSSVFFRYFLNHPLSSLTSVLFSLFFHVFPSKQPPEQPSIIQILVFPFSSKHPHIVHNKHHFNSFFLAKPFCSSSPKRKASTVHIAYIVSFTNYTALSIP